MNIMNLEDKLYTSTEVADILGVSLRSVYRYLEEGKLNAEVKTATGRHRFTRQNILDFLYPSGESKAARETQAKENAVATPRQEQPAREQPKQEPVYTPPATPEPVKEEPVVETSKIDSEPEEPIDWLEKFRAAANKYKEQDMSVKVEETKTVEVDSLTTAPVEEKKPEPTRQFHYYRSLMGGLKDVAQNIDKSAKKASIDYAFTMNAGLSLHKPIKPFSLLHVYIRPEDKEFFERMLNLVSADENNAQLCLITTKESKIFDSKKDMHGLSVVSDMQLKSDLAELGEEQLARELDTVLTA